MVTFSTYKTKIDKKVEKLLEEKQPVIVTRKPGEERVNTNLKSISTNGMEINIERFNEYKIISESFYKLSRSILDTTALLRSWLSHDKINLMERDAILNYLMGR